MSDIIITSSNTFGLVSFCSGTNNALRLGLNGSRYLL